VAPGEIVLIWQSVCPGRAPATTPSAPRIASSTAASEGRRVQTTSDSRATSAADFAGRPPSATRRSTHAGTMS
jgi:hypothetical protein